MSLRQIAKSLGISPAYLSYMVNGKRPWRLDLYERYSHLVNTSVNTKPSYVKLDVDSTAKYGVHQIEPRYGAGDGIRTHDFLLGKQTLYH